MQIICNINLQIICIFIILVELSFIFYNQSKMYNLKRKLQYILIKKDTSVLCSIICLMHMILAPICFYFNYDFLSRYHIYTTILYIIMIMLSKAIPELFLFAMSYLETIAYSIILVVLYGNDAGSYTITLTLLAYFFMLSISSKKYTFNTISPALLTLAEILIIQFADFHPKATTELFTRSFYLIHYSFFAAISIFTIIFISYVIQTKFYRFHEKTKIKTEYLHYSATHDALTKIYNRRRATEILNNYATKPEYTNTLFAASIFDIDNFKKLNDSFGHDCGDAVLRTIADLILRSLPDNTIFARWGGEEFLILFVDNTDTAAETLENMRSRVQDYSFKYFNKAIKLTITIGLSHADKSFNFSKMLIEADENLMKGKQSGKNCVITPEEK